MLAAMLESMSDRGPDSAGFAVYGDGAPGSLKLTVSAASAFDFAELAAQISGMTGTDVGLVVRDTHAVLTYPAKRDGEVRAALAKCAPQLRIVSSGARMEVYKEIGAPRDVARRFGLGAMRGTHAIGHTRMATESAVTTNGAHPFTTGPDQCLVHNGSLSNHNRWRRVLAQQEIAFETANDSEVAAGYLTWRLRQGEALADALLHTLNDLDGFYTFVVGTEAGFGVLRDPIACKPAVMAETDDYVAFGSEYRALVDLPGISRARVWEPSPATPYFWERAA